MVKVVLDTNVILSAILFGGKPRQILDLVLDFRIKGFISGHILAEVQGVLRKKFKFSEAKLNRVETLLIDSFELVEPDFTLDLIQNQPADNRILECALVAKADYLISGDTKHILPLKKIKKIKIITPGQFLGLAVGS